MNSAKTSDLELQRKRDAAYRHLALTILGNQAPVSTIALVQALKELKPAA